MDRLIRIAKDAKRIMVDAKRIAADTKHERGEIKRGEWIKVTPKVKKKLKGSKKK